MSAKSQKKRSTGFVLVVGLGGALVGLCVTVIAFNWLTMRLAEGIAGLTGAEQVLADTGSSAGVWTAAFGTYIALGSLAYCLTLLRRPSTSSTPSASAAIAVLFCVVNALLLITTTPTRFGAGSDTIAEVIESDSDVGAPTAEMLQSAVVSSVVTLIVLLIVWGALRKASFRVRLWTAVPTLLVVAGSIGFIGGRPYV